MPDFTPAHQEDLQTGILGGVGGLLFGLPIIWDSRRNPVSGRVFVVTDSSGDSASLKFIMIITFKADVDLDEFSSSASDLNVLTLKHDNSNIFV